MKNRIASIEDAFAFQLRRLYDMENQIKREFHFCYRHLTSFEVKSQLKQYLEGSDSKILKLERVFNYLMKEPIAERNETINRMLHETTEILHRVESGFLKDLLIINVVRDINAFKVSSYRNVYMYAVELELDTPSDLLQEILDWEREAAKGFSHLTLNEFNRATKLANTSVSYH